MSMAQSSHPDDPALWILSSALGILMCYIVYLLSQLISSKVLKGYNKLSKNVKIEWNNRSFSTAHAIIVAAASLYLLLYSDLFDEEIDDVSIVDRRSIFSNTLLGFSIGYFLSDLSMIIWFYPSLGGLEYIIHHGLSVYSILLSLISGEAQFYILMVLFSEITTPFVNARWKLDAIGLKGSKLYVYNGVALFVGWLVARIILFIYLVLHIYVHFDEVKMMFPLGFYSLLIVPQTLSAMNAYWFWKIVRGLIKTLSMAKHKH